MTEKPRPVPTGRWPGVEFFIGISAVLAVFVASGLVSYLNTRTLELHSHKITHTHEVLSALGDVLTLVKDAETGQRGYLLTGDGRYLEPYTAAVSRIDNAVLEVERLTRDHPSQQARLPSLRVLINDKLEELQNSVSTRRAQGFEAAHALMVTDRGKGVMDAIRGKIEEMQGEERRLRTQRLAEMDRAYQVAVGSGILMGLIGLGLVCAVAALTRRSLLNRERQGWVQSGRIGLSNMVLGEPRIEQLGERVLKFLAEYLDAHAGAFFVKQGSFRRVASYGVPTTGGAPDTFEVGDGLLGQAAKDGRMFALNEVPDGYLTITSALGRGKPRHLVVFPIKEGGFVNGVLELGLMHPVGAITAELLESVSELIGVAIRSAHYRAHVQNLLEETQRQAEELQAQGEELRVSNEELEEQGRALRESQSRLELQQTELEQTNAQLAEQAEILESQRDDATRAKTALQAQTRELEQASRYKSDFLANMSHELRTPLNSSLILAKLLADNREGNLSDEQIQYAETIRTAGNDLLALINDILDLSKIEAGHMDVKPESVPVPQLVEELGRVFRPVAEEKRIEFRCRLSPGCPATIVTDRQRLEQILKNLLSNAIKFTESGEVVLEASSGPDDRVAFLVRDTGIGIPEHQHGVIFEAFRQADGTTNRKYGGTGLGLSISRELSRLLGGDIQLESRAGHGSTFTVALPKVFNDTLVAVRPPTPAPRLSAPTTHDSGRVLDGGPRSERNSTELPPEPSGSPMIRLPRVEDDRQRLTGNRRIILVVEDDEAFARIIYDLAHEIGFHCLIATTAEEGLAVAVQYRPSAVVLDVGLPDHSGLSVLDRLKHDSRTRHIPVHVVSGHDYVETALALGAVGYMLKPVRREELAQALLQLEARLDQGLRRVLIVEDDAVQLDSLRKLLQAHDVETVGARSAGECLRLLKQTTFDCMVLDLSLPDESGYSLLETLSREEAYAFPPVIVYTGRELSLDEEQQLRKYSKSIIIKGAKSPERLLDEVTLFLHQVIAELPAEQQRMLAVAQSRDAALEGRRILVVEDDVRNVFALTSVLEPRGAKVQIARNGREALTALEQGQEGSKQAIDLVLMDIMMPEMDGLTATRTIRKDPRWKRLPIIALTAKAMPNDQEECLSAGANDYLAKPLDVEKLLSLVRVWMPRS